MGNGENYGGKNLKDLKEIEGLEARIQDLTKFLEESQALASHEHHLREEVERSFKSIPTSWKKNYEELKNLKAYIHHQNETYEALKSDIMY